jgi:hypothetical protein
MWLSRIRRSVHDAERISAIATGEALNQACSPGDAKNAVIY